MLVGGGGRIRWFTIVGGREGKGGLFFVLF